MRGEHRPQSWPKPRGLGTVHPMRYIYYCIKPHSNQPHVLFISGSCRVSPLALCCCWDTADGLEKSVP